MTISTLNSNNQEPEGAALREFLSELFLERAGIDGTRSDEDCDSSYASSDSDSISLGSEMSANDDGDCKTIHDRNGTTHHTHPRRVRHSRSLKPQRPTVAVAQDNARAVRVGSYRSNPNSSAHGLGSRTGIRNPSVSHWRNGPNIRCSTAGRTTSRTNHRDSRWSTSNTDIPTNSTIHRVKSYDLGFVNNSLHTPTSLRSKKNTRMKKGSSSSSIRIHNSKTRQRNTKNPRAISLALSCSSIIDRAVNLVNDIASNSSDMDGEEFYNDEDHSFSSFSMHSARSSKSSRTRNKAKALPSSRLESDGFQKSRLRRSDIGAAVSSGSHRRHFETANRKSSDPIGRWAATITTKSARDPDFGDRDLLCRAPRRQTSSSRSRWSTERNSGPRNDSGARSESERSSVGFENRLARCRVAHGEDDRGTATVATIGSSATTGVEPSASYGPEPIAIVLPHNRSPGHSRRISIPESLRKLPDHSFRGSSSISSSTIVLPHKHPGKSLVGSSVRIR